MAAGDTSMAPGVDPTTFMPIGNDVTGQGPGAGTRAKERFIDCADQAHPQKGVKMEATMPRQVSFSNKVADMSQDLMGTMGTPGDGDL